MSLNPLNELKRRLEDDSTPLPKRLCLAKNVVLSHHFPTAPKERVVADWLELLTEKNKLTCKEFEDIIGWLNVVDDLTSELKSRLIQVVSQYLQRNPPQEDEVKYILSFLESDKISTQLTLQIDDYVLITITLLKHLKNDGSLPNNVAMSQRILNNFVKYYKDSKKKLEFIVKLLDGVNLETIFDYLDTCRETVVNVCQSILFPMNKKSFFVSFLQTLIRKDNIDELMAEKGDNIQSVLKIMSTFFTFPKGRTGKDQKFLSDFIDVFVSCFRNESQLVFAFYIMAVSSLSMSQSYLNPAMKMPPIIFQDNDEKIKRNLFLKMLEILLQNEVDISVRLTDTFGEKISKVEIKKNFTSFLQTVMMGQLKLEGKLDKNTLEIIKTALKLDPILIQQKMDQILPPIMTAKKNNVKVIESYKDMMNCLLEMLFKLSRGIIFIDQILPNIKLTLEASNTEQFELKQNVKEQADNGINCDKLKNKIITGDDLFPPECVEMYGRLTSDLLFRQNKELLVSLQKNFEEHCLMMLEEGFVSPSIITLAEVLSAILSSFLRHNKMADHTVPRQIGQDFWEAYQKLEEECLKKFGECVLKLSYNPPLLLAFLKLCVSFSNLKLLNWKYGNTKLAKPEASTLDVFDLTVILPFLSGEQWIRLATMVQEDDAVLVLDTLIVTKTMAINLLATRDADDIIQTIVEEKTHLIKQLSENDNVFDTNVAKVLFSNLDKTQLKLLSKTLVKLYLRNLELEIFKSEAVINNRLLLNAIVLETLKNLTKWFENTEDFSKAVSKGDFDMISFAKCIDTKEYFININCVTDQDGTIMNCIEILKQLPIYYLEESYQLATIFVLLATKKSCPTKKMRKCVDYILQSIFELTPKYPDIFKIFPVDFLFSFEDKTMLNLLTLKIKTSNNLLVIKSILESAVKKVKTDSEIVKKIVELLLKKQTNKKGEVTTIEYFSDTAFQISCIILPIIAKEKKAITASAYRSILANLQEKLHKSMLDCFKNIDFSSSSLSMDTTSNTEDSMVISDNMLATLNAMGAYSLTLSKYCETTDVEEIKNLDCLWSGLEFFVQNAIQSVQNPTTKHQHVDSSIQLLNVVLRHQNKLKSHDIFQKNNEVLLQIWKCVVSRLLIVHGEKGDRKVSGMEDIAVTLKFLCERISVECFGSNFVSDLANLSELKKPSEISKESPSLLTKHRVAKYLWTHCLQANIVGPKCLALSKLLSRSTKTLRFWIQQHFENQDGGKKMADAKTKDDSMDVHDIEIKIVKVEEVICELLRVDLDTISEAIFASKKISLDYKSLDQIFELQHLVHYVLGRSTVHTKCVTTWPSFYTLFEGSMAILNSLLVCREELLEDRWPCYMQCYRALVACLCERATSQMQLEKPAEDKLAEIAHSVEKLTQSISKRKTHVSRIAAYTVADICSLLETNAPSKMVRQHLENSVALLLQASDTTYAVAFLRRALAGAPGHMTMTNLYTMYKRYHKYVGNS